MRTAEIINISIYFLSMFQWDFGLANTAPVCYSNGSANTSRLAPFLTWGRGCLEMGRVGWVEGKERIDSFFLDLHAGPSVSCSLSFHLPSLLPKTTPPPLHPHPITTFIFAVLGIQHKALCLLDCKRRSNCFYWKALTPYLGSQIN
jgi:hypothetical protein